MYLPVPSQPDCASAWREAVRLVDQKPNHEFNNVIIDVENPTARATLSDPTVAIVDSFLRKHDEKPIETVANTIFPLSLYNRHGFPAFFKRFEENVLPRVAKSSCWSGYYFERMINQPREGQSPFNQLEDIIQRIKNPSVRALNKFELSIFDPTRDVDNSPYGGQCLSFASLKLVGDSNARKLALTAFYRNHFYIEKLLGNLIGLGRLMAFIAKEAEVGVGPLTIVSTHAKIDQPGSSKRTDVQKLLADCDQATISLFEVA